MKAFKQPLVRTHPHATPCRARVRRYVEYRSYRCLTRSGNISELREIRANRIGITFKDRFERDPFVFVSHTLLLRMLYALTRPHGKALATKKLRRVDPFAPTPTFVGKRGETWGSEGDPKT